MASKKELEERIKRLEDNVNGFTKRFYQWEDGTYRITTFIGLSDRLKKLEAIVAEVVDYGYSKRG